MPELRRLSLMSPEEQASYQSHVASRFYSVVQLFDYGSSGGAGGEQEWPTRTDEMCRWCMHKFDWFPVGIPMRFDEARHKMVLAGYFCSFACALAYMCETRQNHHYYGGGNTQWLEWLASRAFGIERIQRAPPRELLNRYSIEEFRALSHETLYDEAMPASRAQVLMFEREREIVVARQLVDGEEERRRMEAEENARHAATASAGASKRRRKPAGAADSATESSSAVEQEPPMMPAQWVRTMREQEEKKRGGILNMLGATRKK